MEKLVVSKMEKKIVHISVTQHIPQGLFVKWDKDQEGIIRIREVSWNKKNVKNWKKEYPIGWKGEALLLPEQRGDIIELSLRFAKDDPWDELINYSYKTQVYEGIVTGVVNYGAFIEIMPGLTGLLHHSQIPSWCKKEPMELFWPGDKVLVCIRNINQKKRQIDLALSPHDMPPKQEPLTKTSDKSITRERDNDLEKLLRPDAPRKHVLVVENEEAQAKAMAGWLRKLNQRVNVVASAEEAIDFLSKTEPDIALMDVGLPGMSGTELSYHILENYPHIQAINATDWAHASSISSTLEDLQAHGVSLVLKPLIPEDLVPFLLEDKKHLPEKQNEDRGFTERLPLLDIPEGDVRKRIRRLMLDAKKRLSFEHVILFSLDQTHRKVDIVDDACNGLLNKKALPYLVYSPVRDVAEDKEIIAVNEITEREEKRFQYLSEFCPSTVSCVGIPVPVQEKTDYALFALDKHAQEITNEEQIYLEGVALAIGTALTQRSLKEKFVLMQRTALIGHLTRAMMHEINNLVGPLLYSTDILSENLSQCEKGINKPHCSVIRDEISVIQKDVKKLVNTTKVFGRIVSKGKSRVLRVDEIILETLTLLEDIRGRAKVSFSFREPDQLIIVRSQAVVLEQIFLNVLLNAIQQIEELRPDSGGWVKIDMELTHATEGPMCRILIQDNGPGIHISLWEKIFEVGFTTREDGSGIGLYVSRNLMNDIGGKIFVSASHILGGTLFEMEFPVSL